MVSKKKKKKGLHQNLSFIGNSSVFSPKIRVVSKKKKKKNSPKLSDFYVRFRLVGGDASLTGAELFEMWPKSLLVGCVGGDASPP